MSEPDLARSDGRWVAFTEAATHAGIAAVFAVPVGVGAIRLGALTCYQDHRGPLTAPEGDLWTVADVTARVLVALQAQADPGHLAAELADLTSYRPQVHQAAGMASVQLEVSVDEARIRIQAHAYADGRSLREVADDIVARRLRMARG